jgi:DegV family protein with EDD domain
MSGVSSPAAPILITDSSCDLPAPLIERLGVELLKLRFTIDGQEYADDLGATMPHAEFYARLRAGAAPATAAVPLAEYVEAFTRCAEAGRPALLLGLTAALSSSHEAALTAARMVNEQHPGADIRVVDSVAASVALGFLVLEAAERIAQGDDIDALERWVLEARLRVNGYFALETLEHLRRGGRIPDVIAYAGAMLDLRPVLRIDPRGALMPAAQGRGRRKSIKALVDIAEQRVIDPASNRVVIAHGDAPKDAEMLRELLLERVPFKDVLVTELGPVIATHVGPGMLAVVFYGKVR